MNNLIFCEQKYVLKRMIRIAGVYICKAMDLLDIPEGGRSNYQEAWEISNI